MLLQAMNNFLKNKKGISIVIGYILLISISIIMSVLVYQWLKTYVPTDSIECPEGTSIFIKEISYNCENSELNLIIKNNGRFGINGYFIKVSDKKGSELATIDIAKNLITGGTASGSSVVFSELSENALSPTEPANIKLAVFDVSDYSQLYKVEIIPTRIQIVNDIKRLVSCTNAKVEADLKCN